MNAATSATCVDWEKFEPLVWPGSGSEVAQGEGKELVIQCDSVALRLPDAAIGVAAMKKHHGRPRTLLKVHQSCLVNRDRLWGGRGARLLLRLPSRKLREQQRMQAVSSLVLHSTAANTGAVRRPTLYVPRAAVNGV